MARTLTLTLTFEGDGAIAPNVAELLHEFADWQRTKDAGPGDGMPANGEFKNLRWEHRSEMDI